MFAAVLNILRGIENPVDFSQGVATTSPEQMRAVILMIMEVSILIFACSFSCMVFMLMRIFFFRSKINYPKAYT